MIPLGDIMINVYNLNKAEGCDSTVCIVCVCTTTVLGSALKYQSNGFIDMVVRVYDINSILLETREETPAHLNT